jgi:hypothetical protein
MIQTEHDDKVQSCAGVNRIAADRPANTSVPVGPCGHPYGPPLLKIVAAGASEHRATGTNSAADEERVMDLF